MLEPDFDPVPTAVQIGRCGYPAVLRKIIRMVANDPASRGFLHPVRFGLNRRARA